MEIENIIEKRKELYSALICFIESSENNENEFESFIDNFEKQCIVQNKEETLSFFQLLSKLADNHHRSSDFFDKFEKIFQYLKKSTQISEFITDYSNYNKRILFLLFEKNYIKPNQKFFDDFNENRKSIQKEKSFSKRNFNEFQFCYYLYPSIKHYISEEMQKDIENEILQKFDEQIESFESKSKSAKII